MMALDWAEVRVPLPLQPAPAPRPGLPSSDDPQRPRRDAQRPVGTSHSQE